jgi:hypothetical protein
MRIIFYAVLEKHSVLFIDYIELIEEVSEIIPFDNPGQPINLF